jgi:preprotein translocase subunit SecD
MDDLVQVVTNRLNVYGITDMKIRSVSDLSHNNYLLIELAGATPSELRDLVSQQGKFEAKIDNNSVFVGGKNDITFVCRGDASYAGIQECYQIKEGYYCKFQFEISLSETAAKKQAAATANLTENVSGTGESFLSKPLELYLDDKIYDTLNIGSDLKGKVATQIAISGPGTGPTEKDAFDNAQSNMKKLQTVLITGSLPYKLEIVKLDSISPALGKEFGRNILLTVLAAWIGVFAVLFTRYRKFGPVLLVMFILTCEIYLTVGIAAFIRWNLDLASIAGIIAAIVTGVDDQVVMIDEGKIGKVYSWKERFRRSFGIILGAWATVFVAMLPLGWAGAGLFKGFAITTIIGITLGVFITRPAFADMLEMITKD